MSDPMSRCRTALLVGIGCVPWLVFSARALAGYEDGMEAYRKAWAAYETQRYDEARRWDARAIEADPANPHAAALAGDLAYLAHDLAGARRAWQQALALEPRLRALMERLSQLAQEEALEAGQLAHETPLFVVRTPAGADLDAARVIEELKKAQVYIESQLQLKLRGPISILVYTPEAFYEGFHVPTAVAGLFDGKVRLPLRGQDTPSSNPNVMKYPVPVADVPVAEQAVIWHELTHAAVHQLTHGHAPRWVHEGVAQSVEARVRAIPTEALRIALRRDAVPSLAQLEGRSAEFGAAVQMEAGAFYQTAFAHVQYVLDHRGWEGVRRLLNEMGEGASSSEALSRVTGLGEKEWDRQWRRWLFDHVDHMDAPGRTNTH